MDVHIEHNGREFRAKYRMYGKYIPATHWQPEEYPDIERESQIEFYSYNKDKWLIFPEEKFPKTTEQLEDWMSQHAYENWEND